MSHLQVTCGVQCRLWLEAEQALRSWWGFRREVVSSGRHRVLPMFRLGLYSYSRLCHWPASAEFGRDIIRSNVCVVNELCSHARIWGAGTWLHAGYHLTTAIAGPSLLTLPYAIHFLGWAPGLFALTIGGAVSSYAYCLLSRVLEHFAARGQRCLRFRDLSEVVIG